MHMQGLPLAREAEGGPASCGPNAEPPFVPESSVELPSRGESRRVSGTPAYLTRRPSWQRTEVEE